MTQGCRTSKIAQIITVFAVLAACAVVFGGPFSAAAAATQTSWSFFSQPKTDSDGDGFSDWKETAVYSTNPYSSDTDSDGRTDYAELLAGTDPKDFTNSATLSKHIYISLEHQELRYYTGPYLLDDLLVSTGIPGRDTPSGEFAVTHKVPMVLYEGLGYYYPNTQWNLRFLPGYYIHGAYWHKNFGNKMSHGCVNVSYADVQQIYEWAEVGTPVSIFNGDFPNLLSAISPSHTLLLDRQTIYLIMDGKKHGFTSMEAFTGLGYSLGNVKKGSTTGVPEGYVLDSGHMPHLLGSWVISGQTVFFVAEGGLIPVPSWDIFLSNSGYPQYIVKANAADLSKQKLDLMTFLDVRLR